MFYFTKRDQARTFKSKKDSYKVVDMLKIDPEWTGKRWGVKVL